ncbi:unnamed protein product [Toxocara canis]|uniref:TLDc domain-containing protein n=1 Tax=Toxocara canis TaxID=6265 RepID=A0A183UAW2_TOXCA|nr:unnamed protein product [Toxocara canis]
MHIRPQAQPMDLHCTSEEIILTIRDRTSSAMKTSSRPLPTTQEYLKEPECSAEGKSAVRFPSTLLDQFPSMKDDRRILFSSLHKQSSVANKFDISEHFPSPSAHRFKSDRRDIHKEWVRPRYWPRLDNLARKAVDWSVYRNERARLLKQSTAEQSPLQFSSLSLNVDYSVYAGDGTYKHTLIPPPLFLLLVVKSSPFANKYGMGAYGATQIDDGVVARLGFEKDLRNNFPSSANLHALSAELHGQRLVLAIAHYAAVLFYDIDYRPIQL